MYMPFSSYHKLLAGNDEDTWPAKGAGSRPDRQQATASSTSRPAASSQQGRQKKMSRLWVLNGRIYNYRKEGAIEVAGQGQAQELVQAAQDTAQHVLGLGPGGNKPLEAAEAKKQQHKGDMAGGAILTVSRQVQPAAPPAEHVDTLGKGCLRTPIARCTCPDFQMHTHRQPDAMYKAAGRVHMVRALRPRNAENHTQSALAVFVSHCSSPALPHVHIQLLGDYHVSQSSLRIFDSHLLSLCDLQAVTQLVLPAMHSSTAQQTVIHQLQIGGLMHTRTA